jgi:antitoxin VapB
MLDKRMSSRRVKLFRNGRNQAVRIPREYELPGHEAVLTKDGDRLILEPPKKRGLLAALAQMTPLEEGDFPPIEDLPAEPFDL